MRTILLAAAIGLAAIATQVWAQDATGDLVDRDALRVCAPPSDLPFSDDKGAGFENKIAAIVGDELGLPVTYTYYPDTTGFYRNTLAARLCDVVIGVTSANEFLQNTNPYYTSTFAILYRADAGLDVEDLADPDLKDLSIGAVAQTPPVTIMAQEGLLKNLRSYALMADTRYDHPARDLVADVAGGAVDVGVLWGPIAGYYAKLQDVPMTVVPLVEEPPGVRLHFSISMGVRRNEADWKHRLNEALRTRADDIEAVLHAYGVPMLDRGGRLVGPAGATTAAADAGGVAEPEGYRTDDYRSPVPATLEGATVVDTADAVEALMRERSPILLDVLPAAREPEAPAEGRIWQTPEHETLPGAVWLANTGYGVLPDETQSFFKSSLERLTGGDKDRALLFFCKADCWMSWNAAKRALALGYADVYWYPDGTDDWGASGRFMTMTQPVAEGVPGN